MFNLILFACSGRKVRHAIQQRLSQQVLGKRRSDSFAEEKSTGICRHSELWFFSYAEQQTRSFSTRFRVPETEHGKQNPSAKKRGNLDCFEVLCFVWLIFPISSCIAPESQKRPTGIDIVRLSHWRSDCNPSMFYLLWFLFRFCWDKALLLPRNTESDQRDAFFCVLWHIP